MKKLSGVYRRGGKCFRYDFQSCVVQLVHKAGKEELADNAQWMTERGKPLWDIDESGYMVADTVGLSPENWLNKEAWDEYLDEWLFELDELVSSELAYLV